MKCRIASFSRSFLIKLRLFTDFKPSDQPRKEINRKCGSESQRMTEGLF